MTSPETVTIRLAVTDAATAAAALKDVGVAFTGVGTAADKAAAGTNSAMAKMDSAIAGTSTKIGTLPGAMEKASAGMTAASAKFAATGAAAGDKYAAGMTAGVAKADLAAAVNRTGGAATSAAGVHGAAAGTSFGNKMLTGFMAVGVFTMVAKSMQDSVDAYMNMAVDVNKLKRVTGGDTLDTSQLRTELQLTGVDATKAQTSMQLFSKNLGNASTDSKKTATMVAELGFSFQDANGQVLPLTQLMGPLADKFASMPNGAEKTALAMKLFGRSGADMLPFLNKGSAGLADLAQKSDDLGLSLTDQSMAAMAGAKEQAREFTAGMQGLKIAIGGALLPVMTEMQHFMMQSLIPALAATAGFIKENSSWIMPLVEGILVWTVAAKAAKLAHEAWTSVVKLWNIVVGIGGALMTAYTWAITEGNIQFGLFAIKYYAVIAAQTAWNIVQAIGNGLWLIFNTEMIAANVSVLAFIVAEGAATAATWALDTALAVLTSPITLIIVAIAALAAAVIYAYTHFDWFRTAVQFAWDVIQNVAMFAWYSVLLPIFNALSAAVSGVIDFFTNFGDRVSTIWTNITGWISTGFNAVIAWFAALPGNIWAAVQALWQNVTTWGQQLIAWILNGISTGWTALMAWFAALPGNIWAGVQVAWSSVVGWGSQLLAWILNGIVAGAAAIVAWFWNLPDAIWGTVQAVWAGAVYWGKSLLEQILMGVIIGGVAVWNWFAALPGNLWAAIQAIWATVTHYGSDFIWWVWSGITTAWVGVLAWFVALPGNLWAGIQAIWATVTHYGSDFIWWVWSGITTAWVGVLAWFVALPGNLWAGIQAIWATVTHYGSDFIWWVWSGIQTAWVGVLAWFVALPGNLWAGIQAVWATVTHYGMDFINWVWAGIQWVWAQVTQWFIALPGVLWGVIMGVWSTVTHYGTDFINWVWQGIQFVWAAVTQWFVDLPGVLWSVIMAGWSTVTHYGSDFINWVWQGIQNWWTNVVAWFQNAPGQLWADIQGAWATAVDWGKGLVANIVSGISSAKDTVVKAIEDLFSVSVNVGGVQYSIGLGGIGATIPGGAHGAVVPGTDPGPVDNMLMPVRSGESIFVPEFTRAIGGAPTVHAWNRAAESGTLSRHFGPGFAFGGVVGGDDTTSGWGGFGSTVGKAIVKSIFALLPKPGGGSGITGGLNPSQDPSSFGWAHPGTQVSFNWGGLSTQIAQGTAGLWTGLLDTIKPTIPGGVVSIGGFDDRPNVNNPSMLSFHAYGLAMDVNEQYNPNGVSNQNRSGMYVIPWTGTETIAERYGMNWLGSEDPMHFEIHVSPDQISGSSIVNPSRGGGGSFGTPNPGSGVEQWRGMVGQALTLTGQSIDLANTVLYQMQTESSGDRNAINLTDINAQNGTPSEGLLQVIQPTFDSYAMAPWNVDIWDPLSNTIAAIRYTIARYGSVAAGMRGVAYDGGGVWPTGTAGVNTSGHDELVMTGAQLARSGGVGGKSVTVAAGAVQITVNGSMDAATQAEVRSNLERTLRDILNDDAERRLGG